MVTKLGVLNLISAAITLTIAACAEPTSDHALVDVANTKSAIDVTQATQSFNNRLLEFSNSTGNSRNDAFSTGVTQIELCDNGRFLLHKTTLFSSSVGSFSSENNSVGAWRMQEQEGALVLELSIERTTEKNPILEQGFFISQTTDGLLLLDGKQTTAGDVSEDCQANGATLL